jgi:precorrin-2 dehydrogenase / sirohydrochlorin ferrochelatase
VRVGHGLAILLDVTDRLVVIIGGGRVAARKAAGVLAAGARRVRMIAPMISEQAPAQVERVVAEYDAQLISGAGLVFAATDDPAVNERIVRDAQAMGVLVNRADADEQRPGDFTVPAVARHGRVTLGVSAGGSPMLATLIRDALEAHWDVRWEALAEALAALRPLIVTSPLAAEQRRAVHRELVSEEAMQVAAQGGAEALRRWICARHPELER